MMVSALVRVLFLLCFEALLSGGMQGGCQIFYAESDLCPGFTSSCQCTLNETCGAASPCSTHADPRGIDGACAGVCRQVLSGFCPGDSSCVLDGGDCVPPTPCVPPPAYGTHNFTLTNQGFPGHPGAFVYVPSTFDSNRAALQLVVYVHGFNNCIQNCALPTKSGCNCSVGGDKNVAYGLIDSFESAAIENSGGNLAQSIFVAIEVAYDEVGRNFRLHST